MRDARCEGVDVNKKGGFAKTRLSPQNKNGNGHGAKAVEESGLPRNQRANMHSQNRFTGPEPCLPSYYAKLEYRGMSINYLQRTRQVPSHNDWTPT
jgi:hypothetical protein